MILPLETMTQDSPQKVSIDRGLTEMVPEISIKGHSETDLTEVAWMEKVVDNLEKDLAMMMETGGSLEMVTLAGLFLASIAHAGPSDSTSRTPFIEESL